MTNAKMNKKELDFYAMGYEDISNELRRIALKKILEQMEICDITFSQYQEATDEMNLASALERIWMSEEDTCKGMRKLYEEMFGEKAPYTRNKIRDLISTL